MTRFALLLLSTSLAAQDPVRPTDPELEQFLVRLADPVLVREIEATDLRAVTFTEGARALVVATEHEVTRIDLSTGRETTWSATVRTNCMTTADDRIVLAGQERVAVLDGELTLQRTLAVPAQGPGWTLGFAALGPRGDLLVATASEILVPGSGIVLVQTAADAATETIAIDDRWGVQTAALAPDGTRLAVLTGSGATRLYRLPDGELLACIDDYYAEPDERGVRGGWRPTALTFTRDGSRFALGDSRGDLHLRDVATGEPLARWRSGSAAGIGHVDLGPGRHTLITTDAAGDARLWNVQEPAHVHAIDCRPPRRGRLLVAADSQHFAVVGADGVALFK